MVHLRINVNEPNPNPFINFISALPCNDHTRHEHARQLLRALAAQVRPVMKAHGFTVNSFEEYEFNPVFAGRNWNAGETVELVLRRADGSFYPTSWLMGTLCHELAHIKHMNHGRDFNALWSRLRAEVRQLQDEGYYGDGYWSSGTRLADSARIQGQTIDPGHFPEHICGGAQARTKPTAHRRRRRQQNNTTLTGRQTPKTRKPGGRVTGKWAFAGAGQGNTVSADSTGKGTGFGKQAGSKRAREERATAVERRLAALQTVGSTAPQTQESGEDGDEVDDDASDDDEIVHETDAQRKEIMLQAHRAAGDHNLHGEGSTDCASWEEFEREFDFLRIPGRDAEGTMGSGKGKARSEDDTDPKETHTSKTSPDNGGLGIGKIVQSEIDLRKKEALGLAPLGGVAERTIGARPRLGPSSTTVKRCASPTSSLTAGPSLSSADLIKYPQRALVKTVLTLPSSVTTVDSLESMDENYTSSSPHAQVKQLEKWPCFVCTLLNSPPNLACTACGTPRGQKVWFTPARLT